MTNRRPAQLIFSLLAASGCGGLDNQDASAELANRPRPPTMPGGPMGPNNPMRPTEPTEPTEPTDDATLLREQLLATLPAPRIPAALPDYASDARPAHARGPRVDGFDNTPIDNPITDAGAFLGRVLFYDRLLSANGRVACASCHQQGRGFSDPRPRSMGFDGAPTRRHSMGLVNLRYYERGRMFWDERAATLEEQVLQPIQDPVEMGLDLNELVLRVESASYYPALFQRAFGDVEVSSERISKALAQFVRSMTSFGSRYDEGVAQAQSLADAFPNFSASENRGKALFFGVGRPDLRGSCGTCHLRGNELAPPPPGLPPAPAPGNRAFFFVDQPRHNGLPERDGDDGFAETTGDPRDEGRFKSPSLRDVALTAPYMHDGRLPDLQAVMNFYDRGIQPHPNLDPALRNPDGSPLRFRFGPTERADVIAFLRTLTGTSLQDPKFSSPFPPPR